MSLPVAVEKTDLSEQEVLDLLELVNSVYRVAEDGIFDETLFPGGIHQRTNKIELSGWLRKGEILTARDSNTKKIVGCIHCYVVGSGVAEFGLLAVHPNYRSQGLGRKLIDEAQKFAKTRLQAKTMQLMLLYPKHWVKENKQVLRKWYTSLGYVEGANMEFPKKHLVKTECYFTCFTKPLL